MQVPNAGFRGSLGETPLPQVLRRIFLEQLKGTLSLVRGDETHHLFFEKGELRTATSSREGQRIGAFLKRRGWITDEELSWALDTVAKQGRARLGKILVEKGLVSRAVLDAEIRRLVEEIVFSTFEWETGDYRFQPSTGVLDPDVALTLSTAAIIVEGLRRLPESEIFRELLGDGRQVAMLAADPMSRYQYLPLAPQEAYLLSRIDGVFDVEALLKIGGTSRGATAKTLYALLSCGIVEWKKEGIAAAKEPVGGFAGLNVEVQAQATQRTPAHSELIKNTYRRIDWLTHYELLGITPEATPEQINRAYFERSGLFHPDLRYREDLTAFEKELTVVFERLKVAHGVLADPKTRAEYDASIVAAPVPMAVAETSSDPKARQQLAAESYKRARKLINEKDFHPAVEMLREAIRFVPDNPEYRFTLAQVELKNAKWIDRGLENLMEASRLAPRRQDYLREASWHLCIHSRFADAEPFARRLVGLDPTPENQAILDSIVTGLAGPAAVPSSRGGTARPSDGGAPGGSGAPEPAETGVAPSPEPAPLPSKPAEAPEASSRPTLFSRLFRPRT
jgi:tetratricopeptide (TPR) repeat protein